MKKRIDQQAKLFQSWPRFTLDSNCSLNHRLWLSQGAQVVLGTLGHAGAQACTEVNKIEQAEAMRMVEKVRPCFSSPEINRRVESLNGIYEFNRPLL